MSTEAALISGTAIAAAITDELTAEVAALHAANPNAVPGLAVVLVGDRKDSATYVRNKKKACEKIGIRSIGHDLPADVSQEQLLALIQQLNADPHVHGILVQLPLPAHLHESLVIGAIDAKKDVDGLHAHNAGALQLLGPEHSGPNTLLPCTPAACIELLKRSGIGMKGAHAVVVGRSNIVGKPVATLLLANDCTVTVCHSRTPDIAHFTRQADIVVAACGRAEMIRGDWIKPGATVIDVGINAVDDASDKRGYRLVGDVNFNEAKRVAGRITPVPGGVGPMTIAMLMRNTIRAFKAQAQ